MSFNDDDPIVATQDVSGDNSAPFIAGKTKLTVINKPEAPLVENKLKVMLELTGAGLGKDRSGVDLVVVLDKSGSMSTDNKIEKMKLAVLFLIKKLSPIDRLSVVTFSDNSKRECPLRQITDSSQKEIEVIVKGLKSGGNTNITAGLQTAFKVVNDRTLSTGRVTAIMLMSDGEQNRGGNAAQLPKASIPIYTFGFGAGHDPKVLKAVADNSLGGTFSDVQDSKNLSVAFSQCLAGLLTVVAQDLKLTVVQVESTIIDVSAGNYPQSSDNSAGSVSVSFGDLYEKEVRRVIVGLLLPAVDRRQAPDVLEITYKYSTVGAKLFEAAPVLVTVTRTGSAFEEEREEVVLEENRLETAKAVKDARVMADDKKLVAAQDVIVDAQNRLEDVVVDDPTKLIEMLKSELQQLFKLMKTQDIYEKQGRPYALSFETSHDRQRFASRGDVEKLRLFATPRMNEYLEQALAFDKDPTKPLPTLDEDLKKEIAADPLAPIIGPLTYFIQTAIQSLKSIDAILNKTRP